MYIIAMYTSLAEGLYFTLAGQVYLPGDTVLITDIGTLNDPDPDQAGTALVCVTTNVNYYCCRFLDGGNRGEWFFPDGTIVPRGNGAGPFFRTGSTQQVRLSRMPGVMEPLGEYQCRVADGNRVEQVAMAYINIQLYLRKDRPML